MKKFLLFVFVLILFTRCGTKEFVRFIDKEYNPTSKCVLIENLDNTEFEFEIIGEMSKKVNDILANPEKEMKYIFEEAMNNGADAITGVKAAIFTKKRQTIKYREGDRVNIKLVRFVRDKEGNPIKKK